MARERVCCWPNPDAATSERWVRSTPKAVYWDRSVWVEPLACFSPASV
jgi:hypothetical protein